MMQSFTSFGKEVAYGARLAADSTSYCGKLVGRVAFSPFTGICIVCNNLQPDGHEDTASRRRGFFDMWQEDSLVQTRLEVGATPSLELTNISMKDILRSRRVDKDEKPLSKCQYCKIICEVLEIMFPECKQDWEQGYDTHREIGLMIRLGKPLIICCTNFTVDSGWSHARVDIEVYHPTDEVFRGGLNLPTIGPAAHRSEASNSAESFAFMADCLQQCSEEHDACSADRLTSQYVPLRLIYMGGDQIRLQDDIPPGTTWAALSHCWGGMNVLKLEQKTLPRMRKVIEPRDLPATFKDAMWVAQSSGIDHIWIDSMCIIQDDELDWQQQSAQMADIYRNASLVITAASSPDPEAPFLRKQDDEWLPKPVSIISSDGVPVKMLARRRHALAVGVDQGLKEPPYTRAWATLRRVGPIYKQAWVFQETLLARRNIHFNTGGLVYECKTHRRVQGQLPPYASTTEETLGVLSPQDKWRIIVNAYTYRILTFSKDKLAALSGIAITMSHDLGDEYLAGLWKASLLFDLLWHVMPGATMEVLTFREYVAPSWSWASIDRGVVWSPFKSPRSLITILHAEVTLKGANKYGEVTHGELRLRGRLIACRVHLKSWNGEYNAYIVKNGKKRGKDQWFVPDSRLIGGLLDGPPDAAVRRVRHDESPPYQDFDGPSWLLCVAKTTWANYNHIGLLVCRSAKGADCWLRLGCISNLSAEWYDRGVEQELTLL